MDITKEFAGKHCVLVIENEAVPFDRRMWNIAHALQEAGAAVSVICPIFGKDSERFTVLDGIRIHRYKNTFADGSVPGYFREYGVAFLKTVVLLHKLMLRGRIHVVHAANPPDIFWPLAIYLKLFRIRFIFDEHDLSPHLSSVVTELLLAVDEHGDHLGGHRTVGAGRPRAGERDQRKRLRADHVGGELLVLPAASERTPFLFPHTADAP